MKNYLLFCFALLCAISLAFAQERVVTGTITSVDDGRGIPGVNVILRGSTAGTVTDIDGNFKINVPSDGGTLIFSFVGMITQEIEIGVRSIIDLAMALDVTQLSEVIVIGYGTQSVRNLTSSIASIGSEAFKNVSVPSFEQAIQGKMAGVNITGNSGTLGSQQSIRVRGTSSITGDNQPLFVIDGIPMTNDSGNLGGTGFGGPGTNPLININANDIKSIEVLKDAAAAAIYGSRGTNGVILITTKRGRTGKTIINVNYYTGFSNPSETPDLMNAEQYATLQNMAVDGRERTEAGYDGSANRIANPAAEPWSDHIDLVTRTGSVNEFSTSASGGNELTQFFAGVTYRDEQGFVKKTRLQRFSARLNLDQKLHDKLSLQFGLNPSRTENSRAAEDNNISSPYSIGGLAAPNRETYEADGVTPATNNFFGSSPLADLLARNRRTETTQIISNLNLDFEVLPNLHFRTEFGIEYTNVSERARDLPGSSVVSAVGGQAFARNAEGINWNLSAFGVYNFGNDEHDVEATLGTSLQDVDIKVISVSGNTFASTELNNISSAAVISAGTGTGTQYSFVGFFGRVNYSFQNKYLFSASGRIDGSSRFGVNDQYGFFPAVSAGWIISDESFLNGSSFIDFLKLRTSFGITGNANIPNFASKGLVTFGRDYNGVPGQEITQIANDDLTWEETAQFDVTLDYELLDRIRGSVGYFFKNTTDLLLSVPFPVEVGIAPATIFQNIGEMQNKGFEFDISADIFRGDFNWTASLNIATLDNEVTSLPDTDGDGLSNPILGNTTIIQEGSPLRGFFVMPFAGVAETDMTVTVTDQNGIESTINITAGDALFFNGNGEITNRFSSSEFNRSVLGDPFPDYFGGFTNTFSYKGIDASIFFQFSQGNDIYRNDGRFYEVNRSSSWNQFTSQLNAWTPTNTVTDVPEARIFRSNGNQRSSRYLDDGSYIRLKTATIGYTFPQSIFKDMTLRIYAQGQNLALFTDFKGVDPESGGNTAGDDVAGLVFFSRPQSRTITFGVNLGF